MAKIIGVNTPTANVDAATKQYVDSGAGGGGSLPTGAIIPSAFSPAPLGFLDCDGLDVSRTTYAALFAIIGTTFGVGDGSTTFNLPDLRTRIPIGYDPLAANNTNTLGANGGTFNHQHTAASHQHGMTHSHSMQSHTHSYAHTHTIAHTHTMGNHSHGLRSHVHTIPGHGHSFSNAVVSTNTHAHDFTAQNGVNAAGTQPPRSSNSNANRNESTSADTHTHSYSGRLNFANPSSVNADYSTEVTYGPSNNSTSAISTNTTGGSSVASSSGASPSATTSTINAANVIGGVAHTDNFTGNTDLGGAVSTTGSSANEVPYLVLHYIIKT